MSYLGNLKNLIFKPNKNLNKTKHSIKHKNNKHASKSLYHKIKKNSKHYPKLYTAKTKTKSLLKSKTDSLKEIEALQNSKYGLSYNYILGR